MNDTPPMVPAVQPARPVGVVLARPAVALDTDGAIAAEVICRSCGYNLRGLRPDTRCPECNAEISLSLKSDELRYASPLWLRKLVLGTVLYRAALVARLLILLGNFVVPLVWSYAATRPLDYLSWLIACVQACALWLLTARVREVPRSGLDPERLARIGSIGSLLVCLLSWLAYWLSAPSTGFDSAMLVVWALQSGLAIVAMFLLLTVLVRLAVRIPHPSRARHVRRLRAVGVAVNGSLLLLHLFVWGWLLPKRPPGFWWLYSGSTCLSYVLHFAIDIWFLILLWGLGRSLSQARWEAEQIYRTAEPV